MLTKFTTALGVVLMAGSLAFAQTPSSSTSSQAAPKPSVTQSKPGSAKSQQPAAASAPKTKKHRKHHKTRVPSNTTAPKNTPAKR